MIQTAIVTGAAGQDRYYLVRRLICEGADAHAVVRDEGCTGGLRAVRGPGSLIKAAYITGQVLAVDGGLVMT